ncbi:PEP/pyruvate-binding domain-containing protein [Nocardioides bizhenqiangii]|uniref:PEP/pyruvate-binding domain-containing protein n=1 Tax=Nocardioides bizhenqiangii TaxID=3095076 RepID=A0ABZ0ZNS2_9ACTN|nr:PEP/pyruvate-binding domain-containing protein [Nocardioides sp. HM61]WQQ25867.1 PEP/pyruvate-binding domain-containing protein [Nocardioides sp. HM61]
MSQEPRTQALTPLDGAADEGVFGGKAVQLAAALRAGLPVPGGFALGWDVARAVRAGELDLDPLLVGLAPGPWAVRSSAIGEDSAGASFAGTHLSVLGVVGAAAVGDAVRRVHDSAHDPAAIAYREQHGLDPAPRMAVVLQEMVASDVAGVLFTRHPVTGARERLIEASWGLGEVVVSGQVTPDQYRLSPDGLLLECSTGEKDIALRLGPDGRVAEQVVAPHLVGARCLDDARLEALHRLASACDGVFGVEDHDIEFAFAGERLFLLQRRPITHG